MTYKLCLCVCISAFSFRNKVNHLFMNFVVWNFMQKRRRKKHKSQINAKQSINSDAIQISYIIGTITNIFPMYIEKVIFKFHNSQHTQNHHRFPYFKLNLHRTHKVPTQYFSLNEFETLRACCHGFVI